MSHLSHRSLPSCAPSQQQQSNVVREIHVEHKNMGLVIGKKGHNIMKARSMKDIIDVRILDETSDPVSALGR